MTKFVASEEDIRAIVASTLAELGATKAGLPSTIFDRPISGSWLSPLGVPGVAAAPALNVYQGCWIYVPAETPVDRIGLEVTTIGTSGDTARLSLYKKNRGLPTMTQVLAETTDLDLSTLGQKEATIALTLAPGRYAAMLRCPVKTGNPQIRHRNGGATSGYFSIGHYALDSTELLTDPRGGIGGGQITEAQTQAFPATLTLKLGTRTNAPLIYLRAA